MKSKTIIRLGLLCIVLSLVFGALSSQFNGKTEYIDQSEFPEYKSANQDEMDGWVQLTAVKMTYIGRVSSITTRQGRRTNSVSGGTNSLYLVTDEKGNTLVYVDISSSAFETGPSPSFSADRMPLKLYGHLGNVEDRYSSLEGYDSSLKPYGNYDLVTEYQYLAQVTRVVQTETQKSIQKLMEYSLPFLLGAGLLLIIVGNIKKRRE